MTEFLVSVSQFLGADTPKQWMVFMKLVFAVWVFEFYWFLVFKDMKDEHDIFYRSLVHDKGGLCVVSVILAVVGLVIPLVFIAALKA